MTKIEEMTHGHRYETRSCLKTSTQHEEPLGADIAERHVFVSPGRTSLVTGWAKQEFLWWIREVQELDKLLGI